MKRYILFAVTSILVLLISPSEIQHLSGTPNEDEILEASVKKVDNKENKQELIVEFTSGSEKNSERIIENNNDFTIEYREYEEGDNLVILKSHDAAGKNTFHIVDFVRRKGIYILFGLFILTVFAVTKSHSLDSLLGMAFSFLVLIKFLLPLLLNGVNPVSASILAAAIIIPVTFYLSHGINKKTSVAIIGTLFALILTGFMSVFFINYLHLSGLASDDASFLRISTDHTFNFHGLLLAGIIISLLGILDDITISQSAVVQELKATDKKLSFTKLYSKAMNIGRDHISSIVNTLVLVYAGASLPLFLLFLDQSRSLSEILNYEIVVQEVTQTLIGSIGLVLAVPITTALACKLFTGKEKSITQHHPHHHH